MANKKANTNETAKKTTTKSTTSNAKKTTTKKVETKAPAKKTTTKKVATKAPAKKAETKKATTKKVETVKPAKVEAKKTEAKTVKKVETKKPVKTEIKKTKKVNEKNKSNSLIIWANENIKLIGGIIIVLLLIINIILVTNGHKAKLSNGKEIIASIDGKKFVTEDLYEDLKQKYGSDTLINIIDEYIVNKELNDEDKANAKKDAQANIDSIREQYEAAGYAWEDVLSQYGYKDESVLLQEFLISYEKEIVAKKSIKAKLTDKEIKEYYNKNVYGTYSAKHILVKPVTNDDMSDEEKSIAEEEAKNRAQEVIDRLNNGEDWATLVKEYSNDEGSVDNEGLIENFTHGDVVDEFWDAVDSLKDDEYTQEPVKSSYGYHVVYRVSYTDKKALKDIKDDVVEQMAENKLLDDTNLYTSTWVEIRKSYNLKINDSVIKKAYENIINQKSE